MRIFILLLVLIVPKYLFSQQVADTTYKPMIENPEYEIGKGPIVIIDEGHHNFHTKDGRYKAFSELLERDGYNVRANKGLFSKNKLSKGKILVISNALNKINVEAWYQPNPSAFTNPEIQTVEKWVYDGGSLFLIADHMPMAGAAKDLAATFGFEFSNGFALDTLNPGPAYFSLNRKTLAHNSITKGRDKSEKVEQVVSFTGQAFKIPADAVPILTFSGNYVNMLPDTAWVFDERTAMYNVEGWSQGAYKSHGKGRVVVFGEAAMFTAQIAGSENKKIGMNSEFASDNYQLLLNIIHWLDGRFE